MLGNIRVVGSMLKTYTLDSGKIRRYAYGNKKYGVKESREQVYAILRKLANNMMKSASMKVKIIGKENLPQKEETVLYMSNHKSLFDIIALVHVIEQPVIFIGKKELKTMPLVGTWFESLGCIYLDRENKREALKDIMKGIEELKSGQSVVIFPEGTRISGDKIGNFKEGGFKLATKSGVPIIPIAIHNSYKVLEEKGRIQPALVTVNIGKRVNTKGLTREETVELPRKVESIVKRLMNDIIEGS